MPRLRTQKSEIFILDDTDTGNEVLKVNQVTALPPLTDGPANEIPVTNLDSERVETMNGLPAGQEMTISVQYDPSSPSHQKLLDAKGGGDLRFFIGLSDAATIPTFAASSYTIPTDRSHADFTAIVRDFSIQGDIDDVVTAEILIRTTATFAFVEAA